MIFFQRGYMRTTNCLLITWWCGRATQRTNCSLWSGRRKTPSSAGPRRCWCLTTQTWLWTRGRVTTCWTSSSMGRAWRRWRGRCGSKKNAAGANCILCCAPPASTSSRAAANWCAWRHSTATRRTAAWGGASGSKRPPSTALVSSTPASSRGSNSCTCCAPSRAKRSTAGSRPSASPSTAGSCWTASVLPCRRRTRRRPFSTDTSALKSRLRLTRPRSAPLNANHPHWSRSCRSPPPPDSWRRWWRRSPRSRPQRLRRWCRMRMIFLRRRPRWRRPIWPPVCCHWTCRPRLHPRPSLVGASRSRHPHHPRAPSALVCRQEVVGVVPPTRPLFSPTCKGWCGASGRWPKSARGMLLPRRTRCSDSETHPRPTTGRPTWPTGWPSTTALPSTRTCPGKRPPAPSRGRPRPPSAASTPTLRNNSPSSPLNSCSCWECS